MGFDANKLVEHTEFHLVMNEPESPRALCGCPTLSPEDRAAHNNSECSRLLAAMRNPERSRIISLLLLLQPPAAGALSFLDPGDDVRGGFLDKVSRKFVSYEEVEAILDARIAELGLSKELIESHQNYAVCEAGHELWRLPQTEQWAHFRRKTK